MTIKIIYLPAHESPFLNYKINSNSLYIGLFNKNFSSNKHAEHTSAYVNTDQFDHLAIARE